MLPELDLLFTCVRQHLRLEQRQQIQQLCAQHPIDWPFVYGIAAQHGVAPLVFVNLQQVGLATLGIPPTIVMQFSQLTYGAIATKAGIARKLATVLAFLAEQGQRVMLIKGAALDHLLYQQPWYVTHDIDLIFSSKRNDLAPATVAAIDRFFWELPGFEYDFYTHHDVTMNGVLPVDFGQIWRDAQPIEITGQVAYVMSAEDMVLAACINGCRKRFFRLKSLLAVAELLASPLRPAWPRLTQKAVAYDCGSIVYAALMMTKSTLGCELPEALAVQLGVHPVRARVIRALIRQLAFSPAHWLSGGGQFEQRCWDASLLLPYATYHGNQLIHQLWRRVATGINPAAHGFNNRITSS